MIVYEFNYNIEQLNNLSLLIAKNLDKSSIITLDGDLGSGKTTITKHIIHNLCNNKNIIVTSPTFNIVKTYEYQNGLIWHFDLYRINNFEEILEIGLTESVIDGISIIEWSQIAVPILKNHKNSTIAISLDTINNETRNIKIKTSAKYINLFQDINRNFTIN